MILSLTVSLNPVNQRTSLRRFATLSNMASQTCRLIRPLEEEKSNSAPDAEEDHWKRETSLMPPREATSPRRPYLVNGTTGAKKLISNSP